MASVRGGFIEEWTRGFKRIQAVLGRAVGILIGSKNIIQAKWLQPATTIMVVVRKY